MALSDVVTGLILIILGLGVLVWFFYADKGRENYVKSCIDSMKMSFDQALKYSGFPKYVFYLLAILALFRPGKVMAVRGTSLLLITSGISVMNQWDWMKWLFEKIDGLIEMDASSSNTPS